MAELTLMPARTKWLNKLMHVSLHDIAVELASRGLLACEVGAVADIAIADVHHDSRQVTSGSLFCCMTG